MKKEVELAERNTYIGGQHHVMYEIIFRFTPGALAKDRPFEVALFQEIIRHARLTNRNIAVPVSLPVEYRALSSGVDIKDANPDAPDATAGAIHGIPKVRDALNALMERALDHTGGDIDEAARIIGVSRRTFYRRIEKGRVRLNRPKGAHVKTTNNENLANL